MTLDPKALEAATERHDNWTGRASTIGSLNAARNTRQIISTYLAALPQADPVGRPIDPKLVRYIEMLRHECAYKGPCSDNGDGCYCSAEELNERHMRSASPTPDEPSPHATGVRVNVKPLEWRVPTDHPKDPDAEDTIVCADGIGGVYAISMKQKVGPAYLLWWAHDPMDWTGFDTVAAAIVAAQADYEARIRSALGEQS